MLHELDIKLLMFNNTLAKTMEAMNYLRSMTTLITDICTTVTRLTSCILSLKEGVESFCHYMGVLASHKVNPLMIPPSDL